MIIGREQREILAGHLERDAALVAHCLRADLPLDCEVEEMLLSLRLIALRSEIASTDDAGRAARLFLATAQVERAPSQLGVRE